jgi:hypothetical protein
MDIHPQAFPASSSVGLHNLLKPYPMSSTRPTIWLRTIVRRTSLLVVRPGILWMMGWGTSIFKGNSKEFSKFKNGEGFLNDGIFDGRCFFLEVI